MVFVGVIALFRAFQEDCLVRKPWDPRGNHKLDGLVRVVPCRFGRWTQDPPGKRCWVSFAKTRLPRAHRPFDLLVPVVGPFLGARRSVHIDSWVLWASERKRKASFQLRKRIVNSGGPPKRVQNLGRTDLHCCWQFCFFQ